MGGHGHSHRVNSIPSLVLSTETVRDNNHSTESKEVPCLAGDTASELCHGNDSSEAPQRQCAGNGARAGDAGQGPGTQHHPPCLPCSPSTRPSAVPPPGPRLERAAWQAPSVLHSLAPILECSLGCNCAHSSSSLA